MLINEQGELNREYDHYMVRIEKCKSKEEVNIEFGLHWARMNAIKNKYRQHEKEVKEHGINLGL